MGTDELFHLSIELGGEAVTVSMAGGVNSTAQSQLRELGSQIADHLGGRALILDPGRVTFIDCDGARALLDVYLDLVDRGFSVTIAEPSEPVRRFFATTSSAVWQGHR